MHENNTRTSREQDDDDDDNVDKPDGRRNVVCGLGDDGVDGGSHWRPEGEGRAREHNLKDFATSESGERVNASAFCWAHGSVREDCCMCTRIIAAMLVDGGMEHIRH